MSTRQITKKVINTLVTTVVGFTASNAISSNTTPKNKIQKIEVLMGAMLLSMFMSEKLGEWSDKKVDVIFDWYEAEFNKNKTT